jgi:hypothetical protein
MGRRGRRLALAAAFLAALASGMAGPAAAWGPEGHAVIALIAQSRMSPAAQRALSALIGRTTLDQIASCADELRDAKTSFVCPGIGTLSPDRTTSAWHFINIPVSDDPSVSDLSSYCTRTASQYNPNSPSAGQDCVAGQIGADLKTLSDSSAAARDRRRALMFLVHFVGDSHQPLHCAERMLPDGRSDYGGNEEAVTLNGAPMKLHYVWDDLIETRSEAQNTDVKALARQLEADIAGKDVGSWSEGDMASSAAMESFAIAKNAIYPAYDADGGTMGQDYQARMRPIVYRRLEMAGVRLGAMLDQALGGGASSSAASKVRRTANPR